MNGKPGDDPALDIVQYGRSVYSPEVDELVRELSGLMDFRRLQDLLESLAGLPIEALGAELKKTAINLKEEARVRGWEVE
jgi:hypothetical protein